MGTRDPREVERRLLLDTYRTFGCESGEPTFRYSLLAGVNDGVLINPTLVDARSKVTTQLLSDQGFRVTYTDSETGEEQDDSFRRRHFEKRFFSDATNALFCKTFLENALHDPVGGEIGKSIVFAVSQDHAVRLTQVMNEMADRMFPGLYQSDFAVQVTSQIADAQQFTINFANNNLLGASRFLPDYNTSKARVCITVGMMTTGYDCPDILNLGLFRPSSHRPISFRSRGGAPVRTASWISCATSVSSRMYPSPTRPTSNFSTFSETTNTLRPSTTTNRYSSCLFPLEAMIRMEMARSFLSTLTTTGAKISSLPYARRKSDLRG